MTQQKITIIITVRNESDGILNLLASLKNQTQPADSVIVVDGGSKDDTVRQINKFIQTHPDFNVQLLMAPGTNIATGRNKAISATMAEIIAVTDGGCIARNTWLEKITAPLINNSQVDIVAGYFQPTAQNYLQNCMGIIFTAARVQLERKAFLPSSRSLAFKRAWWQKTGGYPENLYTAEDTLFIKRLLAAGAKMVCEPEAIVFWRQRKNISAFANQIFLYARGDAQARLWKKSHLRPLVNCGLLVFAIFYHTFFFVYVLFFAISLLRLRHRFTAENLFFLPGVMMLRFVQEIFETLGLFAGIFSHPWKR